MPRFTGGVCLQEMSTYGRCLLSGGVHLWEVSAYGRCQLTGDVCLQEMSTYGRCLIMGDVCLQEMSTYGRCLLTIGVHLWEVSASGVRRCLFIGRVCSWKGSAYRCLERYFIYKVKLWDIITKHEVCVWERVQCWLELCTMSQLYHKVVRINTYIWGFLQTAESRSQILEWVSVFQEQHDQLLSIGTAAESLARIKDWSHSNYTRDVWGPESVTEM